MARVSSVLLALALAAVAPAGPFGRFGYFEKPQIAGMKLDEAGFAADFPTADRFRFRKASLDWSRFETSDMHQVIGLTGGAGLPLKARIDLTGPGFSLFFPKGFAVDVGSTSAPFLSWEDGSVAAGLPTPELDWVVVSFADGQPAIVLGLPQGKASFSVTGQAGAWSIEGPEVSGWVRVGLATGSRAVSAGSARALGQLVAQAKAQAGLFRQMPPELLETTLRQDPLSVTGTWRFDRPGATVPVGALLAPMGGYRPNVLSPTRAYDSPTPEGPLEVAAGHEITIRFPAKRVPAGRALAANPPETPPLATVSPIDIPSVATLALENLLATRDAMARRTAEDAYAEFIGQATYVLEPWTGQKLPYAPDGLGADLAAAHALLFQALTSTQRPTSEANALLTSVMWRRDWSSWRLWGSASTQLRRAAGLASIAACLCPEAERRLDAGMLEAGLAAERGLAVWRARRGLEPPSGPMLEVLPSVRQVLFTAEGPNDDEARFATSLLSPVRVYGTTPVEAVEEGELTSIRWPAIEPKPGILALTAGFPFRAVAKANLASLRIASAFGITELRYIPETSGTCVAALALPNYAKRLPPAFAAPAYSEKAR